MHKAPQTDNREEVELSDLARKRQSNIVRELWDFLSANKKWWMMPIILALLLVGFFLILATTGAAPLIYTLF